MEEIAINRKWYPTIIYGGEAIVFGWLAFAIWAGIDMPAGRPPISAGPFMLLKIFTIGWAGLIVITPLLVRRDWQHWIATLVLLVLAVIVGVIIIEVVYIQAVFSFPFLQ